MVTSAPRDTGPLSTRSTSKGALLREAQVVLRTLLAFGDLAALREACLGGTILAQRAIETRRRIWETLSWRYLAWKPAPWILRDLADAARAEGPSRRFVGLLYIHYARRDRLTFRFVTEVLWSRWKQGVPAVRREDVLDFLAVCEPEHPEVRRWREVTRKKLAGNVLSALRDFGLLRGVQRKSLHRPPLDPAVAGHLVRLLHEEGLRGQAVVDAPDWRLFLLDESDVLLALGDLAQRGVVRFERSGRTVILDLIGA
jgi:hypothetical protein